MIIPNIWKNKSHIISVPPSRPPWRFEPGQPGSPAAAGSATAATSRAAAAAAWDAQGCPGWAAKQRNGI